MAFIYIIVLFLSGSLMFSHWIGLLLKVDLRKKNDGNPGATNLWQSAGAGWGLLGVFFDFMKGYLPLGILIWTGRLSGYVLVFAAIAPVFGHAFSPFLKFKGGKSKAVTFGIWSALTNFEASIVLALTLAMLSLFVKIIRRGKGSNRYIDAITAVLGLFLLGGFLVLRNVSAQLILIWMLNLLLFVITNRIALMEYSRYVFKEKTLQDPSKFNL